MVDATKDPEHSTDLCEASSTPECDLKSVRESKGLTLRDIYESTRISIDNLASIEMGHFHLLPSPVLAKSFIKTYAKTLGVNSEEILARYAQYLETLNPAHKGVRIKETTRSTRSFYKVFIWGLLAVITIALVTFSLSSYETLISIVNDRISKQEEKSFSLKTSDAAEKTSQSKTLQQTNAATDKAGDMPSTPSAQAQPAVPEGPEKKETKQDAASAIIHKEDGNPVTYQVIMVAREMTWLRVTADDKSPYEVLLQPGERIERYASHLLIDVGNAGGIDITFRGKPLGNLGERGQVVHIKLPQDSTPD